ncbi:dipeptidase [Prevotella corporis]|uniref:dipeptidase n=2 Tax=Prevotella corporis TaxID=28128 RepID=UPI000406381D|nr:C69 family dipeptidase [Prevotella corporis]MDQ7737373.1 C69 family dipeptidase [Prevotella corporis]
MKKQLLTVLLATSFVAAEACTNFIATKGATKDGSVFVTYSADDYGLFMKLVHFPAGIHAKGEKREIIDYDSGESHGFIDEAPVTYNVIGNINEYQVSIGETTYGGREEMIDKNGIIDYGSLMYLGLQRSKTAREAIKVMTELVDKYGYNSSGESFTIADPNEVWIMEMMGCGGDAKQKVVWVAVRIPDGMISGHANQARIGQFSTYNTEVITSKNCIKFARSKGWFTGTDKEFNWKMAYDAPDFGGRRFCEARVWSYFNHFTDMSKWLPWALGKDPNAEDMPLWVSPNKKIEVSDMQNSMRDHYEGTALSMNEDLGQGNWDMPYRPTPLQFEYNGKKYFTERPASTQQSAFSYVCQLRSWLPREIGGIIWFANDDGNMSPYVPVYCSSTVQPECFNTPGADAVTFSNKNAFWVCNWVSNMVYPRYSQMFPSLKEVRDSLDNSYFANQMKVEAKAQEIYKSNKAAAVKYLNDYSITKGEEMINRWNKLAYYLIVKYNDMAVKPEKDGKFELTPSGFAASPQRPGMSQNARKALAEQTGERFVMPSE